MFFQEIFHKNSQTIFDCIVLGNIRNINVRYSHCGHIPFKCLYYFVSDIIFYLHSSPSHYTNTIIFTQFLEIYPIQFLIN